MIAEHERALHDLARLSRQASPSAAAVGAARARAAVAAQMLSVAALIGLAPPTRTDWRLLQSADQVGRALFAVVEQFGVDVDAFFSALLERDPSLANHPSPSLRRAA